MKLPGHWNQYHCVLCQVDFAVKRTTDKGLTSCPKCGIDDEVYLVKAGKRVVNKIDTTKF